MRFQADLNDVIPAARPRGASAKRLCKRCGIDLPPSRFNSDGTVHVISRGRVKDPWRCNDCQIEV